jgi:hypothetical protein
MKKNWYFLVLMLFTMHSCKKEESEAYTTIAFADYSRGIFYINEGNFGGNNATIGYTSSDGSYAEDPYFRENGIGLGDVLQSATWYNGKVYAVLNNSAKVEVINASDFTRSATIVGCDYPRYFEGVSSTTGFLTNGAMAGEVKTINLNTNAITGSIAVGKGPEQLAANGNTLWVCNSGGWMRDSTVSIIDIPTLSVVHTIDLTDRPMDLAFDNQGYCWVLCAGETIYNSDFSAIEYETVPMLHKINITTYAIEQSIQAGIVGEHPKSLALAADGQSIYYVNGDLYAVNVHTGVPVVWIEGNFQFVDVSMSDGDIWLTEASNFVQPSTLHRYSSAGNFEATLNAGIGTNAVHVR